MILKELKVVNSDILKLILDNEVETTKHVYRLTALIGKLEGVIVIDQLNKG